MKLRIKMNLVQKVKISYPEYELDTADYPELEGKTLDDIRRYIEKHGKQLHPIHSGFSNLIDELSGEVKSYVLADYPDESHFYVTTEEEYTE
ncbi:MAG: hypothetical protein KJP00_08625 [Bacteroidia bacterium]|nr:hypothetical protein [Bacteroidia bacterium]